MCMVAQNKMSHYRYSGNFLATIGDFSIKNLGFKGEDFPTQENCQNLDMYKHANLVFDQS